MAAPPGQARQRQALWASGADSGPSALWWENKPRRARGLNAGQGCKLHANRELFRVAAWQKLGGGCEARSWNGMGMASAAGNEACKAEAEGIERAWDDDGHTPSSVHGTE